MELSFDWKLHSALNELFCFSIGKSLWVLPALPFIPINHVTVQFICHRNETAKAKWFTFSWVYPFFSWLCGLVCPSHHEYCSTCVTEKVNFLVDTYFWDCCYVSSFFLWGNILVVSIQLLSESFPSQSDFNQSFSYFFCHCRHSLNTDILSKDI